RRTLRGAAGFVVAGGQFRSRRTRARLPCGRRGYVSVGVGAAAALEHVPDQADHGYGDAEAEDPPSGGQAQEHQRDCDAEHEWPPTEGGEVSVITGRVLIE